MWKLQLQDLSYLVEFALGSLDLPLEVCGEYCEMEGVYLKHEVLCGLDCCHLRDQYFNRLACVVQDGWGTLLDSYARV